MFLNHHMKDLPPMLTLTLPWPPKELSPNARQHWTKLAKAKKAYREAGEKLRPIQVRFAREALGLQRSGA